MQPPSFSPAFRAELLALLAWRRDVRRFRSDPLPRGALERLIETASLAPSVGLSEPWRFVLVEDAGRRAKIRDNFATANAEALRDHTGARAASYARLKLSGLDDAPVQVAAFAEPDPTQGHGLGRRTMPDAVDYSVALAIHTLWLAARAEGIGLGWLSILDPASVTDALDVPAAWRFVGYLCLGYPLEETEQPGLQAAGWECRRKPGVGILRR